MTKQKIKIEKLTEVKITKLTPEELRIIAHLKIVEGKKTAAGLFRKMLIHYEYAVDNTKRLLFIENQFNELKQHFKQIQKLLNDIQK